MSGSDTRVRPGAGTASEEATYHQQLETYPDFNRYQYRIYRDFAEADGVKWAGSGCQPTTESAVEFRGMAEGLVGGKQVGPMLEGRNCLMITFTCRHACP